MDKAGTKRSGYPRATVGLIPVWRFMQNVRALATALATAAQDDILPHRAEKDPPASARGR